MKVMKTWTKYSLSIILFILVLGGIAGCEKKEDALPETAMNIIDYYPNSGKEGTLVTIEGEGFGTNIGAYKATVNGQDAAVISATATAVVIRIPVGGSTGKLVLSYDNKMMDVGTYTYQNLSVRQVFPANGPAGSQICIGGTGFGSITHPAEVFINEKKALVVSISDTLIVAEVPNEAGSGSVLVKVDGMDAKGQNFTYQAISGIKPLTGAKDTRVVITGEGFEQLTTHNIVEFNGKKALVVESTPERLVVKVPEGVTTGPLSVNINNQKTTGPSFTVVDKPVIQTVTPLSGPKGAQMTINGSLFSKELDENQVYINNILIPLTSANETELKLTVPGGTGSGVIRVVVNDQVSNGPQFKDQNLGITEMTPDNGLTGTSVTIRGTGFSTTASENKVYFNGVSALVKTATENSLVLEAPLGLSTGNVKVVVGGQEALAPQLFKRAGVMTLAGGPNSNTFAGYMSAIATDQQGNIYVTDTNNKQVKKITPSGAVSIFQVNGADAVFVKPYGIVIDKQNTMYVSDQGTNQVIKITSAGQRSVHTSGFAPGHMSIDDAGNLYVNINGFAAGVNKVNPTGNYSKLNGTGWVTTRTVVDALANYYYPDQNAISGNGLMRRGADGITMNAWIGFSEAGYADGIGSAARFQGISSIVLFGGNIMYATDNFNYALREIDVATRKVSTIFKANNRGYIDGSLVESRFGALADMAVDKNGNIYILDPDNKAIRKVFLK
ncbi:hypothetical protein GEO21_02395 [Sphingobacterium faecium]|nr:hypothetical protein [Sphingobacterium faecium]